MARKIKDIAEEVKDLQGKVLSPSQLKRLEHEVHRAMVSSAEDIALRRMTLNNINMLKMAYLRRLMPTIDIIDGKGVEYIPFAKLKLFDLKRLMTLTGQDFMYKNYRIGDTGIFVRSGRDSIGDLIRIRQRSEAEDIILVLLSYALSYELLGGILQTFSIIRRGNEIELKPTKFPYPFTWNFPSDPFLPSPPPPIGVWSANKSTNPHFLVSPVDSIDNTHIGLIPFSMLNPEGVYLFYTLNPESSDNGHIRDAIAFGMPYPKTPTASPFLIFMFDCNGYKPYEGSKTNMSLRVEIPRDKDFVREAPTAFSFIESFGDFIYLYPYDCRHLLIYTDNSKRHEEWVDFGYNIEKQSYPVKCESGYDETKSPPGSNPFHLSVRSWTKCVDVSKWALNIRNVFYPFAICGYKKFLANRLDFSSSSDGTATDNYKMDWSLTSDSEGPTTVDGRSTYISNSELNMNVSGSINIVFGDIIIESKNSSGTQLLTLSQSEYSKSHTTTYPGGSDSLLIEGDKQELKDNVNFSGGDALIIEYDNENNNYIVVYKDRKLDCKVMTNDTFSRERKATGKVRAAGEGAQAQWVITDTATETRTYATTTSTFLELITNYKIKGKVDSVLIDIEIPASNVYTYNFQASSSKTVIDTAIDSSSGKSSNQTVQEKPPIEKITETFIGNVVEGVSCNITKNFISYTYKIREADKHEYHKCIIGVILRKKYNNLPAGYRKEFVFERVGNMSSIVATRADTKGYLKGDFTYAVYPLNPLNIGRGAFTDIEEVSGSVLLKWSPVTDATSYIIFRWPKTKDYVRLKPSIAMTTKNKYLDTGMENNQETSIDIMNTKTLGMYESELINSIVTEGGKQIWQI